MLTATIVLLFVSVVLAKDTRPDARSFGNFDLAFKNSKDNMCPYLELDGNRLPIVCWVCRFPYGIKRDKRYSYDCCPGYTRSELVGNKCVEVDRNYQTILEYLKDKGNVKTADALETNSGLADIIADPSQKVYTVFVPTTDTDVQSGEMDYTGRDNSARMMVAVGRFYSKTFNNRQVIKNENSVNLKITTYSNGLTFLECRLVRSPDHETKNGVVHFLDGAVPPTHMYPSVLSRLRSEPDLSQFVKALPKDLADALDKPGSNEWYTVFAPTNRAWDEAVKSVGSAEAVATLARHHVLDRMICARSVIEESTDVGPTEAGDRIKLTRNKDGNIAVIDACNTNIPFRRRDLMSGNGVVQVIDRAMTSVRALAIGDALNCLQQNPSLGLSGAVRDLKDCGTLSDSKANIILLPNEEALQSMKSERNGREYNRMQSDKKYKCNMYAHQMLRANNPAQANSKAHGYITGQMFSTDYKAQNGVVPTVVSSYSQDPNGNKLKFGAAMVTDNEPIKFRDGVIYPVKTVNSPPERSIVDIIKSESNLREVSEKITRTDMQQEFEALKGNVLFLAPVNMGWKNRNLENGYDKEQTKNLLKLHTIPYPLLGGEIGSIGYGTWQTTDSLLPEKGNGKVKLIIKRNPDGNTFIGHSELPEEQWAMVLGWNKVGTDGVVWTIDWPIKCPAFTC